MRHVLLIAGLLGLLAGRPAFGQCEYELTWIVPPQGICAGSLIGILPMNINDDGVMVGWLECVGSPIGFTFSVEDGFAVIPEPPGVSWLDPYGISDDGVIVGAAGGSGAPNTRAFAYESRTGEWHFLSPEPPGTPGEYAVAFAVNSSGLVVGYRHFNGKFNAGFAWSIRDGSVEQLDIEQSRITDVNENGVCPVRIGLPGGDEQPHVWDGVELTPLQTWDWPRLTTASGLNDRRQFVGGAGIPPPKTVLEAVLMMEGLPPRSLVPDLPGESHYISAALRINDRSVIVGNYNPDADTRRGFAWADGKAWDLTGQVIDQPSLLWLDSPGGINNRGQITLNASAPGLPFVALAAVITPVDPPAADVTGDCRVDHEDLLRVIEDWGTEMDVSDIDGGGIGFSDLVRVLSGWE